MEDNCGCGCTFRVGTIIIAFVKITMLVLLICYLEDVELPPSEHDFKTRLIIVLAVDLGVNILLLIGGIIRNSWMTILWCGVNAVIFALNAIVLLLQILARDIIGAVVTGISLCLSAYFLHVVSSFTRQMTIPVATKPVFEIEMSSV